MEAGYSLVTLTTTGSPELTTVPGAGSILTTVQFDASKTMLYFGFADARFTSVRPRCSRFLRTISAFWPVTSGIVICVGAGASVVVTTGAGACAIVVLVTVTGAEVVVVPHAGIEVAMATSVIAAKVRFTAGILANP